MRLPVAHADPLIEAELVRDHGLVLVVACRVLVPLEQLHLVVGQRLHAVRVRVRVRARARVRVRVRARARAR
eukprot:scaffold22955_cov58-Phaeocystis_antarctica.AAC.4